MTEKTDFNLLHPMRVRWGECDPQGIVFNVNYFLYFDVGVTEYMRALGYHGENILEFFTVNAQADFRASATFDDMIGVAVRCARLGHKSMTLAMAIFRDEELLTEGALTYVHAERGTQTSSALPDALIERVLAFEKTPPERSVR
ncbi:acyl-CoA thioesterase [Hyphococcus sp.]|uniref:acyl-CoA thioesterase n=1 Tax=Hyphococcus sp. TaxID=2038636 RepID=UPI003CCBA735